MARPIQKREQIERGVVRVVAEKGLRGTTIQDIAAAADVSPGLLYRYWKDRDSLAGEVYRIELAALLARLHQTTAAESDVLRKLDALIRAFLQFADEDPILLKFLLLSQHDLSSRVPAEKGTYALLTRLVEEGLAQKRLRPLPPALAVQFIMGLVLQPIVGVIYGHLPKPAGQYYPEITDALRRLFAPGAKTK